jgi:hypothetical protein
MMVWHAYSPVSSESAKGGKLAGSMGSSASCLASVSVSLSRPSDLGDGAHSRAKREQLKTCSILTRFCVSLIGIIHN